MKIAIVGAGIVGVTTAFELACDGHQVTVFERRGTAAEEASFGNAGLLGAAQATLIDASPQLTWPFGAGEVAWSVKARHASPPPPATLIALQQLADLSLRRLTDITHELQLEIDHAEGCLLLLRDEKAQKRVQAQLQAWRAAGVAFLEIDAQRARQIEPALSAQAALVGAIHLPDTLAANCRQFALALKAAAQRKGVHFEFSTTVAAIEPGAKAALRIAGEDSPRPFDAVVVCAGCASSALLQPHGLKLPLAGVSGYSVSAHLREPLNAPNSAVWATQHPITITRLGQRVRVAGGAELGGKPHRSRAQSLARLYRALNEWFPGAAQVGNGIQEWKGTSASLPDHAPLIGASSLPGVWLNLGHGNKGWALACASARVLADHLASRQPEVDISALGVARFGY